MQGQAIIDPYEVVETGVVPVTDEVVETYANFISYEVVDEVAETYVPITDEVAAIYPVHIVDKVTAIGDTKITTSASTEPFVHIDGQFPGGPSDRSVHTNYGREV